MAKTYGNRWELVERVSGGGQGEVFRVKDKTRQLLGEFALKRILNPRRRDRFINEVNAIKKLSHSNIITLIDHSALDADSGDTEKQYIVMPLADGDLGKRAALYEHSIDQVIHIADQVAAGLSHAHEKGIIHRDIKPQNLLFMEANNHVLITDFGICLIREEPRHTETNEVVGPRFFMAPELEGGGQLDITPAVDVYSLGKVMFYMLSGGTLLPREDIHLPQYARFFAGGQRHVFLQTLLTRMVAPLQARITTMDEVRQQISRIAEWDRTAQVPFNPSTMSALNRLQQRIVSQGRENIRVQQVWEQTSQLIESLKQPFAEWLEGLLMGAAAHIDVKDVIHAETAPAAPDDLERLARKHFSSLTPVTGYELRLHKPVTYVIHALLFVLAREGSERKPDEIKLVFFAGYRRVRTDTGKPTDYGFVNSKGWVEMGDSSHTTAAQRYVSNTVKGSAPHCDFKPLEFPANMPALRKVYDEALEVFLEYIDNGGYGIGP
jgi:serine/threonine protein kinase